MRQSYLSHIAHHAAVVRRELEFDARSILTAQLYGRSPGSVSSALAVALDVLPARADPAGGDAEESWLARFVVRAWFGEFPGDAARCSDDEALTVVATSRLPPGPDAHPDPATTAAMLRFPDARKTMLCVRNLERASRHLLGPGSSLPPGAPLSAELALEVHRTLGSDGLIPGAGSVRRGPATSVGGVLVTFVPHTRVLPMLRVLTKWAEGATRDPGAPLTARLAAASVFYSEFLLIHPFADGNGRAARLLLAYALRGVLPVPLAIGVARFGPRRPEDGPGQWRDDRDRYLMAMYGRNDRNVAPYRFGGLLLLSAERAMDEWRAEAGRRDEQDQ